MANKIPAALPKNDFPNLKGYLSSDKIVISFFRSTEHTKIKTATVRQLLLSRAQNLTVTFKHRNPDKLVTNSKHGIPGSRQGNKPIKRPMHNHVGKLESTLHPTLISLNT